MSKRLALLEAKLAEASQYKRAAGSDLEALLESYGEDDPTAEQKQKQADLEGRLTEAEASIKKVAADIEYQKSVEARNREPDPTDTGDKKPVSRNKFANIGEQVAAVFRAGRGQFDQRLAPQAATPAGMNEGQPSDGGFLVQSDFDATIMSLTHRSSVFAPEIPTTQVSGNSITFNRVDETSRANGSRWGGVRAYWRDEAGALTLTSMTVGQGQLKLNSLSAYVALTDELLEDQTALTSEINRVVPLELAFKLDDAIVRGTGAGQPMGILNAGCTVSVTKETGQAASTIVFDNIKKMYERLHPSEMAGAKWYVHHGVPRLLAGMTMAVGSGGVPVYLPAMGASSTPYGLLYGLPVVVSEVCAAPGTVGDIILANMKSYKAITKGGVKSDSSIHVYFTTGQTVLRWTIRYDAQPTWASALTPYTGGSSYTTSPLVTLATRA